SKFDQDGNCLWAKKLPKSYPTSIASDSQGNIVVIGAFSTPSLSIGSLTVVNAGGLNPGSTQGPGGPCTDMFVMKLNSLGNPLWLERAGGTFNESARKITIDAEDNIYIGGDFTSDSMRFNNTQTLYQP